MARSKKRGGKKSDWRVTTDVVAAADVLESADVVEGEDVLAEGAVPADTADVGTVDAILAALYASVSYAREEQPEWNRLRGLFAPIAQLVHAKPDGVEAMDLERFILRMEDDARRRGFVERADREIGRRVESFGQIAHIFSAFESVRSADDTARGIHSLQLVFDHDRWWIVSVVWDDERPDNHLPASMLRAGPSLPPPPPTVP